MSLLTELRNMLPEAGARLSANVLMASRTTFRIGGPAEVFFEPANPTEIIMAAGYCRERGIPLTILGNGSNILVSDLGISGLVMVIGDRMADVERRQDLLVAGAGIRLASLAAFAAQNGLSGLEFASGIPGTLGGAILMNAGAYEHCMAEVVVLTEYLDENLDLQAAVRQEHHFGYRCSRFSEGRDIILRACIALKPGDSQEIYGLMADLGSRRRSSQPLEMPSAGSAFKRPAGNFAGKLISDCGLQGCRIGNAQVSPKHAGFIVNLGEASAADTRMLFAHVQSVVADKAGVLLEPEVRFIGDWQDWPAGCARDKE